MWFIIFLCLINSSNYSFVLILHVQSLSFVGPPIFLNTFLSNNINFYVFFYGFFQDPYFTAICYCWSYNTLVEFQFWFLEKIYFQREIGLHNMLYFQVLSYIGSFLLSCYHYLQLIPDICRTRTTPPPPNYPHQIIQGAFSQRENYGSIMLTFFLRNLDCAPLQTTQEDSYRHERFNKIWPEIVCIV